MQQYNKTLFFVAIFYILYLSKINWTNIFDQTIICHTVVFWSKKKTESCRLRYGDRWLSLHNFYLVASFSLCHLWRQFFFPTKTIIWLEFYTTGHRLIYIMRIKTRVYIFYLHFASLMYCMIKKNRCHSDPRNDGVEINKWILNFEKYGFRSNFIN